MYVCIYINRLNLEKIQLNFTIIYIYIFIVRTRFESLVQTVGGLRPNKPKTMNL